MKERSGMPYDVVAISTDELALQWTPAEEGIWHRLIRHAWLHGSIPGNPAVLATIARIPEAEFLLMWPILQQSFHPQRNHADRLVNNKQEHERRYLAKVAYKEMRYQRELSKRQSIKGKLGMAKRWANKDLMDNHGYSPAMEPVITENNPLPLPLLLLKKKKKERIYKKESPEPLIPHGEFLSVLLTATQLEKLEARLNGNFGAFVDRLDRYSQTHPAEFRKYKSHYAVLLTWFDRDVKDGKIQPTQSAQTKIWKTSEYL